MTRSTHRLPRWVPYFNVIARPLLAVGVRLGPDMLITVRGRRTGLPRSTPVTICENGGRRGLISPFGETHWVRNLRAAGRATIRLGSRREELSAVELGRTEAAAFIRDVVAPHARRSWFGEWFVRNVDRIDIDHPDEAAQGRPVFELFPRDRQPDHARGGGAEVPRQELGFRRDDDAAPRERYRSSADRRWVRPADVGRHTRRT